MKACTKCGLQKPLIAFSKHRITSDGYSYWCKDCDKKRARKYAKTPEGVYTRLRRRHTYFKKHNDKREKPFLLEKDEFMEWHKNQPKKCYYCGLEEHNLFLFTDKYGARNALTVDCMDNDRGYILENIILACDKCNLMKNNILTHEEMLFIGRAFIHSKWERLL